MRPRYPFSSVARDPGRVYQNGTICHPRAPNTSLLYPMDYFAIDVRINVRSRMVPPISKYKI
jgi:hypothetical protein